MDEQLSAAKKLYKDGKYQEAAAKFQEVLRVDPGNVLAHHGLAASLIGLRRYEEAVKECYQALELNPNFALSHVALATIYWRQKQYAKAKSELDRALGLEPGLLQARILLGEILLEQQDYDGAIRERRKVFELEPSFQSGWRIILAYTAKYKLYWALAGCLIFIFIIRSPLTIPIFVISECFTLLNAWYLLLANRRQQGWSLMIAGLVLIPLYIYHLWRGL